jgi:hypothetical protein
MIRLIDIPVDLSNSRIQAEKTSQDRDCHPSERLFLQRDGKIAYSATAAPKLEFDR